MIRLTPLFRSPTTHLSLALLLCALPGVAAAQGTTIYRCTDAAGTLTVQNLPCPSGTTQRKQQVQDVSSSPATAAPVPAAPVAGMASPVAPMATSPAQTSQTTSSGEFVTTSTGPEPQILDSANLPRTPAPQAAAADPDRPPLPPLFRCATYDGDSYLAEDQEQPPRCLALRTVGLDGNPAGGAGRACEVVRDQCSRVPDGAACEAWHRYAREAESRFRFAHPDNVERRRTEYERLAKIVSASCGG